MWVVVKIMVPFWVLDKIRHLLFRVSKKRTIILTTTHIQIAIGPTGPKDSRTYLDLRNTVDGFRGLGVGYIHPAIPIVRTLPITRNMP